MKSLSKNLPKQPSEFHSHASIELGQQSQEAPYVASVMGEFHAFDGVGVLEVGGGEREVNGQVDGDSKTATSEEH